MDRTLGLYAKWNKSDLERQKLHDLTYVRNLNKTNSTDQIGGFQRQGAECGSVMR